MNSASVMLVMSCFTACTSAELQPYGMEFKLDVPDNTTRAATITDEANLKNFVVCANTDVASEQIDGLAGGFNYYDHTTGLRIGNDWLLTPPRYWPISSKAKLDIYALSPAGSVNINSYNNQDNQVMLDYVVPSTNGDEHLTKKQEDLLVAVRKGITATDVNSQGKIELTFKHVLALVRMSARNRTMNPILTITQIAIFGLHNHGSLNLSATPLRWQPLDSNQTANALGSFQLSYAFSMPKSGFRLVQVKDGSRSDNYTKLYNAGEGLFILPQVIPQGFEGYVRITFVNTFGSEETRDVKFPVNTSAQTIGVGTIVDAQIDITDDANCVLELYFNHWSDHIEHTADEIMETSPTQ